MIKSENVRAESPFMIPSVEVTDPTVQKPEKQGPPPILFWAWLLLAMGLYALVMLSPRLAEQELLLTEYQSLNEQLDDDQSRLDRLRQIEQSLQQHPELSQRILNGEASTSDENREILPLPVESTTSNREVGVAPPTNTISNRGTTHRGPHWYAPIVIFIGQNGTLRAILLLGVIIMILVTFVSIPPIVEESVEESEQTKDEREAPRKPNFLSRFKERYGNSGDDDEVDDDLEARLLLLTTGDNEWELDALPVEEKEDREEVSPQDD